MDNPSAQIKINICSTSCSYHVILLGPHIVKSNINRIHPMQIIELITIPCWKFNSIQINDNCCFVQLICYCLHVQIYDPIFMCLGLCRKAKVQHTFFTAGVHSKEKFNQAMKIQATKGWGVGDMSLRKFLFLGA